LNKDGRNAGLEDREGIIAAEGGVAVDEIPLLRPLLDDPGGFDVARLKPRAVPGTPDHDVVEILLRGVGAHLMSERRMLHRAIKVEELPVIEESQRYRRVSGLLDRLHHLLELGEALGDPKAQSVEDVHVVIDADDLCVDADAPDDPFAKLRAVLRVAGPVPKAWGEKPF